MFLTRREPNQSSGFPTPVFRDLRQEMDRLFDDWASEMSPFDGGASMFRPQINVVENEKHLAVTAELPGMEQKDVEVELTSNALTLRGKKEKESTEENDNWYRRERSFGSFERVIPLPWKIDDEKAKADAVFKNGLLTVTVDKPKEAKSKAKKLQVKAA